LDPANLKQQVVQVVPRRGWSSGLDRLNLARDRVKPCVFCCHSETYQKKNGYPFFLTGGHSEKERDR